MLRFLFFFLLFHLGLSLQATRPVRSLRTLLPNGQFATLPYRPSDSRPAHCPSDCAHRSPHTRALYARNRDGLGELGKPGMGVLRSIGRPIIPIIMVEFSDVEFQYGSTQEKFDSLLNHPGYRQNSHSRGSVRDYFVAQSYGLFQPSFDIVGKVKLQKPMAYYGKNSNNSYNAYVHELYREAIAAAQGKGVDFSRYIDGNGVPLVVLLHAGPGEHDSFETGREDYIWAHFSESFQQVGGIRFQSYFVGCELMQTYQSTTEIIDGKEVKKTRLDEQGNPIVQSAQLEGIGVFCHELCHALGLPDFYSTDQPQHTPDFHDLMDYGQYGNEGYRPVGLSAYERNCLGWLQLTELSDSPQQLTLAPLPHKNEGTHPQAYLIRNPNNEKEYYILENRQPYEWFFTALGHGMLIHHIDYDETAWRNNRVNIQSDRLRYSIVPADGKWQHNKEKNPALYAGDFFPGPSQAKEFTSLTSPAMIWHEDAEARPLYNIVERPDGFITCSYLDRTLSTGRIPTSKASAPLISLQGHRLLPQQASPGIYLQGQRKIIVR